jgi:hypothetical protein
MTGMFLTWTIFWLFSAFGDYNAAFRFEIQKEKKSIKLNNLPSSKEFKILPYVRAAALLQEMGKENACEQLEKLAKMDDEEGQVAILCRLLFSKKGKMPFRSPFFGDPIYMGGTSDNDWPLSPTGIVDDVPFFIVYGYRLGGLPEPSIFYLKYCLKNCEWSKTKFSQVNDKAVEKALKELLACRKWKRPLTDFDRRLLIGQTK